MVPRLLEQPLSEVARSPDVAAGVRAARPRARGVRRSSSSSAATTVGVVVLVDLSDQLIEVAGKFVTYALYPQSAYSVLAQPLEEQVQDQHRLQPLVAGAAHATTSPPSASGTAAAGTRWSAPSRCRSTRWTRRGRSRGRSPRSSRRERARPAGATAPLVVGHRGGRGEGWPRENTLAAFEQARSTGARAVELDVRTCEGAGHRAARSARRAARPAAPGGARRSPRCSTGRGEHGVGVNVEMKHDVPSRLALARAHRAGHPGQRGRRAPLVLRSAAADDGRRARASHPARAARPLRAGAVGRRGAGSGRDRRSSRHSTSSGRRPNRARSPATSRAACASASGR